MFRLLFDRSKEVELFQATGGEQALPLLGMLSELAKRFAGLSQIPNQGDFYGVMRDFATHFGIDYWAKPVVEEPVTPTIYYGGGDDPLMPMVRYGDGEAFVIPGAGIAEYQWLWLECLALIDAIDAWLVPGEHDRKNKLVRPGIRFYEAWDARSAGELARAYYSASGREDLRAVKAYRTLVLQKRLEQTSTAFTVREGRYLKGYGSLSLMALLWAEVLNCVETGTFAFRCRHCGGIFPLKPPYGRQFCSDKCRNEGHIATWPGGLEGYREYMRQKKRESRARGGG